MSRTILVALILFAAVASVSAERAGARDLGIPLEGTPGQNNAITDVDGVMVGHTTLIRGDGPLEVGQGPVRTGVTVVLPRAGDELSVPAFAAVHALNGVGEMTGSHFIEETGFMAGPIAITNTHSVGVVRDAVSDWLFKRHGWPVSLPVVGETLDGGIGTWTGLNDANGRHVTAEHVFDALDGATSGTVLEGSVGGGTGMICNGFKGGIGTASRVVATEGAHTVGVLLQCNYGVRRWLRVAGVPVGAELDTPDICFAGEPPPGVPVGRCGEAGEGLTEDLGSIIVIVATDAPLLPHQLERVARRVSLGLGRLGSASGEGSGDIFLAFSTARADAPKAGVHALSMLSDGLLNPIFEATVQATEEAVLDAMFKSPTMTGANDLRVPGLPHAEVLELLRRYRRLD